VSSYSDSPIVLSIICELACKVECHLLSLLLPLLNSIEDFRVSSQVALVMCKDIWRYIWHKQLKKSVLDIQHELNIKLYKSGHRGTLSIMSNRSELKNRLLSVLKEIERERQYRGLKDYVRNLKQKEYLNGKEKFILRGSSARLNRLQADRRSKSLGLVEFVPYDERDDRFEDVQGDYRSWDRSVGLFF